MREIKFRAWDIKREEIRIVRDIVFFSSENTRVNVGKEKDSYVPLLNGTYGEKVKEFELMQFTGLKDKNGKEIYESDILQNSEYDGSCDSDFAIGRVEWCNERLQFVVAYEVKQNNGTFRTEKDCFEEFGDDFQVIGNIYENLELIK